MNKNTDVKSDMKGIYKGEAAERDSEEWLAEGDARIPESKASHYFIDRKVGQALRLAPITPDMHVVEIGCSFGYMTFLLAQHAKKVTAVDLSEESIDLAQRRAQHHGIDNIEWQVGDAEALSYEDNAFDAAYSFSTIRFCPDPQAVMNEAARIVKPGSPVVVDFPNKYCPWFGPLKGLMGIKTHAHDTLYSVSSALDLMKQAELTELEVSQFLLASKRLPAFVLPFAKIAETVLEPLPLLNKLTAIIMARGVKVAAS
jgi:SAM-dependent methyltransferase